MTRVIRVLPNIRVLRVTEPGEQANVVRKGIEKVVKTTVPIAVKGKDADPAILGSMQNKIEILEEKLQEEENKISVLDDPGDLALLFNSI